MIRRAFITLLGGAAAWPVAARAQDAGHTYRIGFLVPTPRDRPAVAAFFDELKLNGFIENENLEVLPGGFDVRNEELAQLAAQLVQAAPDVIVAGPDPPSPLAGWSRGKVVSSGESSGLDRSRKRSASGAQLAHALSASVARIRSPRAGDYTSEPGGSCWRGGAIRGHSKH